MLNREKHQLLMGRILRDIYGDVSISPSLGFKGGTCAYLFYDLPRFSVDLDFDWLPIKGISPQTVFSRLGEILERHGHVKERHIKKNTLFFLLSYGEADHNIKVEVSTRTDIPDLRDHFELKEYLGISILVGKKSYLFASKLAALTLRAKTAMRDIYDIWYFAEKNWDMDVGLVKKRTNKTLKDHLAECLAIIEKVKDNQILQGLGELLSEKEKAWVKNSLRKEVTFLLRNYISVLS